MTPQQYRRWYDFSRRMALRGFPDATDRRRAKIAKTVRHVIRCMEGEKADITDWDAGPACPGDRVSELLDDRHYHEKVDSRGNSEPRGNRFLSQVSCCVRAGLDMASGPSGGVLGWTVGDLRRMYPHGIPAWVLGNFSPDAPITAATPDEAGVWL